MPRVSKKQAEENHREVVSAAARLFRERGINGVSVPALMAEAGLTHGAFYGHFASKDELAARPVRTPSSSRAPSTTDFWSGTAATRARRAASSSNATHRGCIAISPASAVR